MRLVPIGSLCVGSGVDGVLCLCPEVVACGVDVRESLPHMSESAGRSCCGIVKVWWLGWLMDATQQKARKTGE